MASCACAAWQPVHWLAVPSVMLSPKARMRRGCAQEATRTEAAATSSVSANEHDRDMIVRMRRNRRLPASIKGGGGQRCAHGPGGCQRSILGDAIDWPRLPDAEWCDVLHVHMGLLSSFNGRPSRLKRSAPPEATLPAARVSLLTLLPLKLC